MTIKELIEHQNNNSVVCFIRQGLFYRAYNQGAVLLNTMLGYRIKHKELLSVGVVVHYVGFPTSSLEQVLERVLRDYTLISGNRVIPYVEWWKLFESNK